MKLYVGNLSWNLRTDDLREIFSEFGKVVDAIVLTDRESGRSRGFGFVTFESREMGERAMEEMDGQEVDGRPLRVNEAQERAPRSGGGGGGRGGFGGGGGRGGRGGGGGGRGGFGGGGGGGGGRGGYGGGRGGGGGYRG